MFRQILQNWVQKVSSLRKLTQGSGQKDGYDELRKCWNVGDFSNFLVATFQWSGKAKSFLYTKHHHFVPKTLHITQTLVYFFYPMRSLFTLTHFSIFVFLICWNPLIHCLYTIHLPQNFKHLNSLIFASSQTHSSFFQAPIFGKMVEKINVSVRYMYVNEDMQENFEKHFYRRSIARGRIST